VTSLANQSRIVAQSQSKSPQYNSADYVGSEAARMLRRSVQEFFADDEETTKTHAILGGFKARPRNDWTLYFDTEHDEHDNVFARIGNYDYTNFRLKSRYKPSSRVALNVSVITKDNSNPAEIAAVFFGVNVKSRIFISTVDWTAASRFAISGNYHWINSKSIVDYFFNSIRHPLGNSLYIVRNNFLFVETSARVVLRTTLFAAYGINKDNGQGNRIADSTGTLGR
jgi:hypothetical protein